MKKANGITAANTNFNGISKQPSPPNAAKPAPTPRAFGIAKTSRTSPAVANTKPVVPLGEKPSATRRSMAKAKPTAPNTNKVTRGSIQIDDRAANSEKIDYISQEVIEHNNVQAEASLAVESAIEAALQGIQQLSIVSTVSPTQDSVSICSMIQAIKQEVPVIEADGDAQDKLYIVDDTAADGFAIADREELLSYLSASFEGETSPFTTRIDDESLQETSRQSPKPGNATIPHLATADLSADDPSTVPESPGHYDREIIGDYMFDQASEDEHLLESAFSSKNLLQKHDAPLATGSTDLTIGPRIDANYQGKGKNFQAKVTRDRENDTFDEEYDDGGAETLVKAEPIPVLNSSTEAATAATREATAGELREGTLVEANCEGKGKYSQAKVIRDWGDDTFDVEYDDGDTEHRIKSE